MSRSGLDVCDTKVKHTVTAEGRRIHTEVYQGVQHGHWSHAVILGCQSKPGKISDKIHIDLEPEFPPPSLQR